MAEAYETEILQVDQEINALADVFRRERVSSFLEIGSKFGGSLWRLSRALQVSSRIVAIDMPNGTKAWKDSGPALDRCIERLRDEGHVANVLWGSSSERSLVEQARSAGPYDAVFIDGDHRLPGLTADWENYGPMGRLVAFHDIAWRRSPEWVGIRIDVPKFWDSIKGKYRHEEFRLCPTGKNNGIGVLWRC